MTITCAVAILSKMKNIEKNGGKVEKEYTKQTKRKTKEKWKTIKGEKPVKAGGKLLVIDGGFSKAYQPETGIAGYTLIFHSRGLQLTQHEPFQSAQKAIEEGIDIISTSFILELNSQRMMVRDTDIGKELETQIKDLKKLLIAYRNGFIKEKS